MSDHTPISPALAPGSLPTTGLLELEGQRFYCPGMGSWSHRPPYTEAVAPIGYTDFGGVTRWCAERGHLFLYGQLDPGPARGCVFTSDGACEVPVVGFVLVAEHWPDGIEIEVVKADVFHKLWEAISDD